MRNLLIAALALCAGTAGVMSMLAAAQEARPPVAPAGAPPEIVASASEGAPVIEALTIDPSRFVLQCQPAALAVAARDVAAAGRSRLAFDWAVLAGPPGATLAPEGAAATFSATAAGDYQLRVTVTGAAASAARTFAVHVLAGGAICPLALGGG
jgi:hypothetical protein